MWRLNPAIAVAAIDLPQADNSECQTRLSACAGVFYHLEAMAIYFLKKEQKDENVTSLLQVLRMPS
jgi:hypothetical protein